MANRKLELVDSKSAFPYNQAVWVPSHYAPTNISIPGFGLVWKQSAGICWMDSLKNPPARATGGTGWTLHRITWCQFWNTSSQEFIFLPEVTHKRTKFYTHTRPSELWKRCRCTKALNYWHFKQILSQCRSWKCQVIGVLLTYFLNQPLRMSSWYCPYSASTFHTMEREVNPANSLDRDWEMQPCCYIQSKLPKIMPITPLAKKVSGPYWNILAINAADKAQCKSS